MLTASPITNQPVGKTFTVAISLLGAGAGLTVLMFVLHALWHWRHHRRDAGQVS